MKNLIAFTLAVGSFVEGHGQNWCTPGAQWNNDYFTPFGSIGYVVTTYNGDVIFADSLCQELSSVSHVYSYPNDTVTVYAPQLNYTYTSTDVVYLWNGAEFDTLYNFGALPEDQWRFRREFLQPDIQFTVVATGTTNVDGESLRFLVVEVETEGMNSVSDIIYERVGTERLFWNILQCEVSYFDVPYGRLRCYNDDDISVTRVEGACEIALNLPELDQGAAFGVFPNPGNDRMRIDCPHAETNDATLEIYDLRGALHFAQKLTAPTVFIDVSDLSPGLYMIRSTSAGAIYTQRWQKE